MTAYKIEVDDIVEFNAQGPFGAIEDRGTVIAAYQNGRVVVRAETDGRPFKVYASDCILLSKGDA